MNYDVWPLGSREIVASFSTTPPLIKRHVSSIVASPRLRIAAAVRILLPCAATGTARPAPLVRPHPYHSHLRDAVTQHSAEGGALRDHPRRAAPIRPAAVGEMREVEGEHLRFRGRRSGLDALGSKALAGPVDGPYLEEVGRAFDEAADGVGGVSGAGRDPAEKMAVLPCGRTAWRLLRNRGIARSAPDSVTRQKNTNQNSVPANLFDDRDRAMRLTATVGDEGIGIRVPEVTFHVVLAPRRWTR